MQARRHLKPIKKQVRRNRLRDGADLEGDACRPSRDVAA
jgi:hypothetical protein